MRTTNHLQTMALSYQEICQGERPWVALGNFMNDWFDYAKDRRAQLIADPIFLPESPNDDALRWAAFCTASVEWLCERYSVLCPSWVHTSTYCLSEPGLTRLTQINHMYVNGSSNTHQSHLPGAISIVVTACLLTSTNSPNNTAAFLLPCLLPHRARAKDAILLLTDKL